MSKTLVVTGTDTDIGKTIFAAGLTGALGASYWKPIQAGLADETDSEVIARLTSQTTLPETYRLKLPASPHLAAEAQGVVIDPKCLHIPSVPGPLVIEGAGGLMVPVNRDTLFLDVFAGWQLPIVLCARTQLGTINHTLLSLRALAEAKCSVIGVAFIGDAAPEVEKTICDFGNVRHLGRLSIIQNLTPDTLRQTFTDAFNLENFR